jgi:6-phosphogluconate dehydrogenase
MNGPLREAVMAEQICEIGLVGLGVMGKNLVLNMADRGFSVAVFNRTTEKTRRFIAEEVGDRKILPGYSLAEFVGLLRKPRAIVSMVPAGQPVDEVIDELVPHLDPGDLIIDGGNSHFRDTDRRSRRLSEERFLFMGMGVSGGEEGARHGPSVMPGGSQEGYDRVKAILEAAAAKAGDGEPCVTYLGPGSAGHYVKMVHNGIEYGIMELIAETYDLLRRGWGLTNEELHSVYSGWNQEALNGYLLEITAAIFLQKDEKTGNFLVDMILDRAKQKGTGKWTSIEAMELQAGTSAIDAAVVARDLSSRKTEREAASQILKGPKTNIRGDRDRFLRQLREAFYGAMIITYGQGMDLLRRASQAYAYGLNLEAVARIWRGGCIIRAALLEEIRAAYRTQADLPNLLLDRRLGKAVMRRQADLRSVVCTAARKGLPVPVFMASLAYFDAYRSGRLPANLIQAQRDFFGAHTYERIDEKGVFHTRWEKKG